MGKLLLLLFLFVIGPVGVLAFVAYFKEQNRRWANGQPSFFDRANWLGDVIRRYLDKR